MLELFFWQIPAKLLAKSKRHSKQNHDPADRGSPTTANAPTNHATIDCAPTWLSGLVAYSISFI
jgi:hypothetical protein